MKQVNIAWLALPMACLIASPVMAGGDPPKNSSDTSGRVLAISVVLPVFVVSASVTSLVDASSSKSGGTVDGKAGKLPPMKVVAVRTAANGGREVALMAEGMAGEDAKAALRWAEQKDDPAKLFHVGEMVTFRPSAGGAGWTVHDARDEMLTFVPTVRAAGQSGTKVWE
jgi:hypothetical protein